MDIPWETTAVHSTFFEETLRGAANTEDLRNTPERIPFGRSNTKSYDSYDSILFLSSYL